ncbi:MAG: hypothetical protein LUJ25_05505 [Firmicutes bacterium]|nr:hypothetical protein [Bacillota bacterium]
MRRIVKQTFLSTTNIDVWLEDPDITELRRAELLAARDRVAAIKTAAAINGTIKEEDDDRGAWEPERTAGTKISKTTRRRRNERDNLG